MSEPWRVKPGTWSEEYRVYGYPVDNVTALEDGSFVELEPGQKNRQFRGVHCAVQGGSDISGTLSKFHYSIKKSSFLLILSQ
jgi:hypothetical protein